MTEYPIKVRARDANGREVIMHRQGGGGRTLAQAGTDYYPTVLWTIEGNYRIFDPSRQSHAWGFNGGPDSSGPYTLVEVLQTWQSDDPLKATERDFTA